MFILVHQCSAFLIADPQRSLQFIHQPLFLAQLPRQIMASGIILLIWVPSSEGAGSINICVALVMGVVGVGFALCMGFAFGLVLMGGVFAVVGMETVMVEMLLTVS